MVLLLLVLGCARPDACEAWAEAARDCAVASGADPAAYDLAATCSGWDDDLEAHYGAWYRCQADAYADADCSTGSGYAAAQTAAACCTPPGAEPADVPECQ